MPSKCHLNSFFFRNITEIRSRTDSSPQAPWPTAARTAVQTLDYDSHETRQFVQHDVRSKHFLRRKNFWFNSPFCLAKLRLNASFFLFCCLTDSKLKSNKTSCFVSCLKWNFGWLSKKMISAPTNRKLFALTRGVISKKLGQKICSNYIPQINKLYVNGLWSK